MNVRFPVTFCRLGWFSLSTSDRPSSIRSCSTGLKTWCILMAILVPFSDFFPEWTIFSFPRDIPFIYNKYLRQFLLITVRQLLISYHINKAGLMFFPLFMKTVHKLQIASFWNIYISHWPAYIYIYIYITVSRF